MKGTAFNWCNNTFNPWEGCTKISPGCANCYAKARDNRRPVEPVSHWGPGAPRRIMSDDYWEQPLAWNREAANAGTRPRVFCGSLCDWADDEAPAGQRDRLWELIRQTPHLDWLLLTKRANNIRKYLPTDWRTGYPNVWLGVTVENRRHGLPRIEVLREIPAVVRFASCEPLIEDLGAVDFKGISWVIVGGETGTGARPMSAVSAKSIIYSCREQGAAAWMKQLGLLPMLGSELVRFPEVNGTNADNMEQWPNSIAALKVRELPQVDPNAIAMGTNAAELGRIESELGRLADGLGPEQAAKELELRKQYIRTEPKLFLTRQERGRILADYRALYSPLRKWSKFLRIVGLPRQTAYDLLPVACVKDAEADRTVSVQSPREARPAKKVALTTAQAIDRAAAAVERALRLLPEQDRANALDKLVERLRSTYVDAAADRKAA